MKVKQESCGAQRSIDLPLTHEQESIVYAERLFDNPALFLRTKIFYLGEYSDEVDLQTLLEKTLMLQEPFQLDFIFTEGSERQRSRRAQEYTSLACKNIASLDEIPQVLEGLKPEVQGCARFTLIRQCKAYYLAMLWHQLGLDDVGVAMLQQTLKAALDSRQVPSHSPHFLQHFIESRKAWMYSEACEEAKQFWSLQLQDYQALPWPNDFKQEAARDFSAARESFRIDKETLQNLAKRCDALSVSIQDAMLGLYYLCLKNFSGDENFLIGVPFDLRAQFHCDDAIGNYSQYLPLRLRHVWQTRFDQSLRGVKQLRLDAQQHAALPFSQLVREFQASVDLAKHPLFQVALSCSLPFLALAEPYSKDHSSQNKQFVTDYRCERDVLLAPARFDLYLHFNVDTFGPYVSCNYASTVYRRETVTAFMDMFKNYMSQFSRGRDPIKLQSKLQNSRTLVGERKALPSKSIIEQIAANANDSGDSMALVDGAVHITYRQLIAQVDKVASFLLTLPRVKHAVDNAIIALYFNRGHGFVIAWLAVMRIGATALPLSVKYPVKRNIAVLLESEASCLLTSAELHQAASNLIEGSHNSISLALMQNIVSPPGSVARPTLEFRNFHYLIYTSGSSGKPKGVLVAHNALHNLLAHQKSKRSFTRDERALQLAEYVFDASILQYLLPLYSGACVILARQENSDPEWVARIILAQAITHLDLTPSFLELVQRPERGLRLKRVSIGGESCTRALRQKWGDLLINEYGPTESCITAVECQSYIEQSRVNCIGAPVANTRCYVLSKSRQLLDTFMPGELGISGMGLAEGYFKDDGKHSESFIPNPFSREPGYERIYLTGDRVRILPDQQLEFLGRVDEQVKLRGFRVELGEIEYRLRQLRFIKDVYLCCSQAGQVSANDARQGKGEFYLFAYLCLHENLTIYQDQYKFLSALQVLPPGEEGVGQKTQLVQEFIDNYLREYLPVFMLPHAYHLVATIPKNSSGKVDRRLLPVPELQDRSRFEALSSSTEKDLANIWQALLTIEHKSLSRNADFFQLGGHSLLATRLKTEVLKHFAVEISLREIFRHTQISTLSALIDEKTSQGTCTIEPQMKALHTININESEEIEI